jgi:hypothetical protein
MYLDLNNTLIMRFTAAADFATLLQMFMQSQSDQKARASKPAWP